MTQEHPACPRVCCEQPGPGQLEALNIQWLNKLKFSKLVKCPGEGMTELSNSFGLFHPYSSRILKSHMSAFQPQN